MRNVWFLFFLVSSSLATTAHAGPFAPKAGAPGSTAISKDSPSFTGWATDYQAYLPGSNVDAAFKTPAKALGPATGNYADVVSLGDNGSIVLTFAGSIFNGVGADFAVFENSFSDTFLELARVSVSSDGVNFFRFPAFSLTASPVGAFGEIDPTNIEGFAGKYRGGYGTPFDLSIFQNVSGLDINHVRYVKITDVVGDGKSLDDYPTHNKIYDPYPTTSSGGFDLEAVGAIHLATAVPEASTVSTLFVGLLALPFFVRRHRRVQKINHREKRSLNKLTRILALVGLTSCATFAQVAAAAVATFEDLGLAADSFFFPGANTPYFFSGPAKFNHTYNDFGIPGCCWQDWTYSSKTDSTTPGFLNQYSAYPGGGAAGSQTYGVAFIAHTLVEFAGPSIVDSADFANTTYTALSMLNGDSFAKKFGGTTGNDPDYLKLKVVGMDKFGNQTGAVDIFLADYRFADNSQDYVLNTWKHVDLTRLGAVSMLGFALETTDVDPVNGPNTPLYFAIDNISVTAVPEPSTWLTLAAGVLLVLSVVQRRRMHA